MPAMILLSGIFAKAEVSTKVVKSTLQLLATWGVWEGLWAVAHFVFGGKIPGEKFLVSPAWTLWFLVSLATMRILLPYLARFRHPLLASIVLALVGGLSPAIGTEFSASRTLCFLPFFMIGWLAKRDGWFNERWFMKPTLGTRGIAWAALGLFAIAVLVLAQFRSAWRFDSWLLWRYDYLALFEKAPIAGYIPDSFWSLAVTGGGMRLALIALAVVLTLALLIVLPRRSGIASVWGARTLYVYLLHGPIVQAMRSSGFVDWFGELGAIGIAMLVVIGVGITLLLSMGWVTKVFRLIIEPPIDRLFAREKRG